MWGGEMLWMKTQRKYSENTGQIYTRQYETKIRIENILHLEAFVLSLPRFLSTVKRLFSLKLQSTEESIEDVHSFKHVSQVAQC